VESVDGGNTWSVDIPRRITNYPRNAEHPTIVQTGELALLAWDDGHTVYLSTSLDGGQTWQHKDAGFGASWYPTLYQAPDGTIWFVWISQVKGTAGTIKYTTSLDGKSWADEMVILDGSTEEDLVYGNPTIHQLGDEILVAFDTGAEAKPVSDIYLISSVDGGQTWSEPISITPGTPDLDDVDPMFCKVGDTLLLFYASSAKGGDYDIYYRVLSEEGWSGPILLPPPISEAGIRDWYPACYPTDAQIWLTWASNRVDVVGDEREVFIASLSSAALVPVP
jgi:hypothetical protein